MTPPPSRAIRCRNWKCLDPAGLGEPMLESWISICMQKQGYSQRDPGLGMLRDSVTAGLAGHLLFPAALPSLWFLPSVWLPTAVRHLPSSLSFPSFSHCFSLTLSCLSVSPPLTFLILLLTLGSHPQGPFSSFVRAFGGDRVGLC